jgi:predicted transcriptional regulator
MRHEEFQNKLDELKLGKKDFSDVTNVPYTTVSKYGKSNPVPPWVGPFLDLYEENRNLSEIKELIEIAAQKISKK